MPPIRGVGHCAISLLERSLHPLGQLVISNRVKPGHRAFGDIAPLGDRPRAWSLEHDRHLVRDDADDAGPALDRWSEVSHEVAPSAIALRYPEAVTTAPSPSCPRCGATMVRKPVRRGPRAGLEMWSCTRWPDCRGAINIDPEPVSGTSGAATDAMKPLRPGAPGAYAQARLERERQRARLKRRAALPLFVAAAVIVMTMTFYSAQPLGLPAAATGAVITGSAFLFLMLRLPFESLVWAKGVEGERRTAGYLEPLLDAGFVVLHNRRIPGARGDIDHLVVGPTGVFPIETKNWSGRVEVRNDRLFVGDHDRTWVVEQVYREALAV